MPDMLVKLYDLPDNRALLERLRGEGVAVKRAMTGDKQAIVDFVGRHFTASWRNECETAFAHLPVHCYIAVKQGEVIGFACHDVVVKNFFGPTGVLEDYRGLGIGKALLLECLSAMHRSGYGYAIIGWVADAVPFYEKTVGAIAVPDSFPGVFRDLISMD